MPVDRATFTREFTLLLERFGRDPHQLMTARYFAYVDERLTTTEFEAAAREIFENDQFWPAPARFLHAAKGDPKRLAANAWTQLLTAAQTGNPGAVPRDAVLTLKRTGATFRDIETANEYRLKELERAFKDEFSSGDPSTAPQRLPAPDQAQLASTNEHPMQVREERGTP